jgi:hypothetical protein
VNWEILECEGADVLNGAVLTMPFPAPNERPGDERRMKIEFGLLLACIALILILSVRWLWDRLSALF